jgi:hypothetical protein
MDEKTTGRERGPRSELGRRWAGYTEKMRDYIESKNPRLKESMEAETWELFCLEVACIANRERIAVPAEYSGNRTDFVQSILLSFLSKPGNDIEKMLKENDKNEALSFRTWVNHRLWWFMLDRYYQRLGGRKRRAKQEEGAPAASGADAAEGESEAAGMGDDSSPPPMVSMDEDGAENDSALSVDSQEEIDNRIYIVEILQRVGLDSVDASALCLWAAGTPRKEAAAELGMTEMEYKNRLETLKKKLNDATEVGGKEVGKVRR